MLRSTSAILFSAACLIGCGGVTKAITGPVKATPAGSIYVIQENVLPGVPTPDLKAHDLLISVPADATGATSDTYVSGPAGVTMSGIATDTAGNVYVGAIDENTNTAEVLVYARGAKDGDAPLRTIVGANTGLHLPLAIAVDRKGNVYVADFWTGIAILEFSAGATGVVAPARRIIDATGGVTIAPSLAVDSKGELFMSYPTGTNQISVFSEAQNGSVTPTRVLKGANTKLSGGFLGICMDANDNLFVTSFGTVDGKISGLILQFAPDASGDVAPTRVISGANAGVNGGFSGIAIDQAGTLFVETAPPGSGQIVTYASSATGMAPVRTAPLPQHLSRPGSGIATF